MPPVAYRGRPNSVRAERRGAGQSLESRPRGVPGGAGVQSSVLGWFAVACGALGYEGHLTVIRDVREPVAAVMECSMPSAVGASPTWLGLLWRSTLPTRTDTATKSATRAADRRPDRRPVASSQFWFGLSAVILSITSLTEKLAALARGGNSLKLSMYSAMMACAGTNRTSDALASCRSLSSRDPARTDRCADCYKLGARSLVNWPCQTPMGFRDLSGYSVP